jgi:hypothetical protein
MTYITPRYINFQFVFIILKKWSNFGRDRNISQMLKGEEEEKEEVLETSLESWRHGMRRTDMCEAETPCKGDSMSEVQARQGQRGK